MNLQSVKDLLKKKGPCKIYILPLIGILIFAILLKYDVRFPGTDDYLIPHLALPYHNVFSWMIYRYHTWSGRIFGDAFFYLILPAPLFVWKIISLVLFVTQSIYFYLYYKLWSPEKNVAKDRSIMAICCIALLLIDSLAFFDGVLWPTGGIAYLWMGVFGIVGFYPFAYYLKYKASPHKLLIIMGLLSIGVASSSQEQVGALLCGLSIAGLAYLFISKNFKPLSLVPILTTILSMAGFIVSIKSPGDAMRYKAEIATWLPTFLQVSTVHRIEYSYRWVLDATLNHTGILLVGIWVLLGIILLTKKQKDTWDYGMIFVLGIGSIVNIFKGYSQVSYFLNFYDAWGQPIPTLLGKIILLPWLLILIASCVAPLVAYRKKLSGVVLSILLCASYASIVMIVFSPTMYASGWRTLYIPSLALIFIFLLLLSKVMDLYKKHHTYVLILVFTLALSQGLFLIERLLSDVALS